MIGAALGNSYKVLLLPLTAVVIKIVMLAVVAVGLGVAEVHYRSLSRSSREQ
jgi:hypothetical protein